MKKGWLLYFIITGLFFMTLTVPVKAEETGETDQKTYLQIGRDDEARDAKLIEEAEKRWKSKRPHSHTLEDAKNSAQEGRGNSPRYLLRETTKEEQIKKNQDVILNDE